jgi:hypothetical protein
MRADALLPTPIIATRISGKTLSPLYIVVKALGLVCSITFSGGGMIKLKGNFGREKSEELGEHSWVKVK